MRRGEVWWVELGPRLGGEVRKRRPAVIVSNDAANRFLNRLQVVPLTSNVDKLYPSEAYVTVGGRRSKAMADQITTVSKQRLTRKLGAIAAGEIERLEHALLVQLGMAPGGGWNPRCEVRSTPGANPS